MSQGLPVPQNRPDVPRPRCFLVTVGNSLIGHYLKMCPTANFTAEAIEELSCTSHENCNQFSIYKAACEAILKALQSTSLDQFKKSSAELSSLYHIEPIPGSVSGDKVIFIATQTPTGHLCANLLRAALTGASCLGTTKFPDDQNHLKIEHPKGLGRANDPKFADEGLPQFMALLSELIQNHENNYDVVLIPTGGYKSLIPYATLAGILHKKEVKYIYEDSDVLMSLPQIPVGLDTERWKPAYVKLKALTTLPKSSTEVYFKNLDRSFQDLLDPPEKDTDPYKFTAIGTFLVDRYLHLRYQTPLQHQTRGTSLLKFLARDKDKPDLQQFFLQLVKIGPYLWLGDKIPEVMDHALHHHTNLFEIAELMLLPILEADKDFLWPEELFVLLCTIYFHDSGHVLSHFPDKPDRPLLPTQIRDFHHILGYERLKSEDWRKKLIQLGLKWTNDNHEQLWEKYLKLIGTIGMFHRKSMPLKQREKPYFCPVNEKNYESLTEAGAWPLNFEENSFSNHRAVYVAALFRIIDSLDNQVTRAGTGEEIQIKAAVLKADAEAEKHRKEAVRQLLEGYLNRNSAASLLSWVDDLIKRITGAYRAAEITGHENKETTGREEINIEQEIGSTLNSKISQDKDLAQKLVWLYIDAACRAFFKEEQPRHYLKHLALENPRISYSQVSEAKVPHLVTVELRPLEIPLLERYRNQMQLTHNDLPDVNKIMDNIEEEYDLVREILREQGGLSLRYERIQRKSVYHLDLDEAKIEGGSPL
ncbi:MAG: hypothetical protein DDT19_02046 [Syntrophomonadaceae bacterium]|nr:hypothetical protein [Bacillota bacterium]